jgi:hypothetical protein
MLGHFDLIQGRLLCPTGILTIKKAGRAGNAEKAERLMQGQAASCSDLNRFIVNVFGKTVLFTDKEL